MCQVMWEDHVYATEITVYISVVMGKNRNHNLIAIVLIQNTLFIISLSRIDM